MPPWSTLLVLFRTLFDLSFWVNHESVTKLFFFKFTSLHVISRKLFTLSPIKCMSLYTRNKYHKHHISLYMYMPSTLCNTPNYICIPLTSNIPVTLYSSIIYGLIMYRAPLRTQEKNILNPIISLELIFKNDLYTDEFR